MFKIMLETREQERQEMDSKRYVAGEIIFHPEIFLTDSMQRSDFTQELINNSRHNWMEF